MPSDDLAQLISRVGIGDRSAFAVLYGQASPKLFGICLRMMKDRMEAEDALQEVFIRIWHRAASFSMESRAASAWLAAIARHHCIDRLRARHPGTDDLEQAWDLADDRPDPEHMAMASSDGKRIDTCLQQLDSDRAQAIRLAYVEGASYQQLADRYGVPLNTMRTWLRRGLLRLRECLDR